MHSRDYRILIALASMCVILGACGIPNGIASGARHDEPITTSPEKEDEQSRDIAEPNEEAKKGTGLKDSESSDSREPAQQEPASESIIPAELSAGTVVTDEQIAAGGGEDAFFWAEEISDQTFARMEGKSFGQDCTVPRENLRYVKVLHVDADNVTKVGELVVNTSVADEVVDIFRQLYDARWPIKKMHLVDDYDGSDDLSCADGNTAAFNFRMAVNANVLSNHSYGLAIDINTFENPYYVPSTGYVYPPEAARFLDRGLEEPYMIHRGDLCYRLFTERGWSWGGDWSNINDFQHFEKV